MNGLNYNRICEYRGGVKILTKVYFVRHAKPDHSWSDDRTRPLTPEGKEDAAIVLNHLKDSRIDVVYCSPYQRSIDTIRETANYFGLDILIDERFRERESGQQGNSLIMFEKRWDNLDYHEEDGESIHMVQKRNMAALEEILVQHDGQTILIGTHGTALSSIFNYYCPEYRCKDFLRIIDWMPYIVEFEFNGQDFVKYTEIAYIEKPFHS